MSQISEEVLKITLFYIGPASRNLLEHETYNYLNKLKFDKLEKNQLPELVKWLRASACLFIGKEKSDEMSYKIMNLANM